MKTIYTLKQIKKMSTNRIISTYYRINDACQFKYFSKGSRNTLDYINSVLDKRDY